jgi:hypothetical protein
MPLAKIWTTDPDQLRGKLIHQVIAFAGDGKLRDDSQASREFRDFLELIPLEMLQTYADGCLQDSFTDSGLALQDLVNEVGRRLDFEVEKGRYRGSRGKIGFDGLWRSEDGHALIVEVKTTDTYRIELGKLAEYRKGLIAEGKVREEASSVLIVVGRANTEDLEAQIRGSRQAWDVRLISIKALLKLVGIKVKLEDPRVVRQIRSILVPHEYTRVDDIVDLVFVAAEDVAPESDGPEEPSEEREEAGTSTKPVDFNDECAERIERHLGKLLVKQSRVTWRAPDNSLSLVCKTSRVYENGARKGYWFAIHSTRYRILAATKEAWVGLGCGSPAAVILVPYGQFLDWSEGLNVTIQENGEYYWHVRIVEDRGRYELKRKKGFDSIDLTPYLLQNPASGPSV